MKMFLGLIRVFVLSFFIFIFFNFYATSGQVNFYPKDTDFSKLYEESISKGNFKEAFFFLRLWFANEPDVNKKVDILFLIANFYEVIKNYKEAKSLYRQIIITYPESSYVKKAKEKLLEINKLI